MLQKQAQHMHDLEMHLENVSTELRRFLPAETYSHVMAYKATMNETMPIYASTSYQLAERILLKRSGNVSTLCTH